MDIEIEETCRELLISLSRLSQVAFEIRDTDGRRLFPEDDPSEDAATEKACVRVSQDASTRHALLHESVPGKADIFCIPVLHNGWVACALLSRFGPGVLESDDDGQIAEDHRHLLAALARLIEAQISFKAESDKMAEELTQSFEDLYLYSRIESHGRTLHFSETMLRDLVEELMQTMRAQMAFTSLPEVREYETLICDPSFTADVPDLDGFTKELVAAIPSEAPSLSEGFFIVNDSAESDAYRVLHPEPFRFLAVTIQRDDKFFGYLCMVSFDMGEIFRRSEFWLLKSLASSTAAAFENSRLYTESLRIAERERLIRNIFQKYVPKAVAEAILKKGEQDLIKLGEKRLLTLLNVDIRGYSRMSKRIRAEDMVQVLNYFFRTMGTVIMDHDGIVDKYLGDGLLAIFGAPAASENSALDAALAAIEMVDQLEAVDAFSRETYRMQVQVGISINTGEAIVGNIGFENKMDYTVIGDVVNDTFRLQELTREKMNSIYISESTRKLLPPDIAVRSLGQRMLGKNEQQMVVYEVTGTTG